MGFRKLIASLLHTPDSTRKAAPTLTMNVGNAGVEVSFSTSVIERPRLVADHKVNQTHPRDTYVYAHEDQHGNIFYVGRGSGRRAWSVDRDPLWHRYVQTHLSGRYVVRILADGLSDLEADQLEGQWIDQENEGLINLQNMARRIDIKALRRRDELMARNKALMGEAKALEKKDVVRAIALYREAFSLLKEFALIPIESGLYAKVFAEQVAEQGPIGQISLLDRLTLCLIRAGQAEAARASAQEYFEVFKKERTFAAAKAIEARLARAFGTSG